MRLSVPSAQPGSFHRRLGRPGAGVSAGRRPGSAGAVAYTTITPAGLVERMIVFDVTVPGSCSKPSARIPQKDGRSHGAMRCGPLSYPLPRTHGASRARRVVQAGRYSRTSAWRCDS